MCITPSRKTVKVTDLAMPVSLPKPKARKGVESRLDRDVSKETGRCPETLI